MATSASANAAAASQRENRTSVEYVATLIAPTFFIILRILCIA
jgi:hypothetical protein